jgi:hypothetical protein
MAQETVYTDAEYNHIVARAVEAARCKAEDARDNCPHSPIGYAGQEALHCSLTGQQDIDASTEVYENTRYAVDSNTNTADVLAQIQHELLRVSYE